MRKPAKAVLIGVFGGLAAIAASVALLIAHGAELKAQPPPAACACSRATPLVGVDEVTSIPGQLQPRYGITHCQCGVATCVATVAYGSVGIPQLFCVKS